MNLKRNPGNVTDREFVLQLSFDELQLLSVAIKRLARIQAGHIQNFCLDYQEQLDGVFPSAPPVVFSASPPRRDSDSTNPLVQTGQGSYRRNWPEHTAELLGGDPGRAVAEAIRAADAAAHRSPLDCLA